MPIKLLLVLKVIHTTIKKGEKSVLIRRRNSKTEKLISYKLFNQKTS